MNIDWTPVMNAVIALCASVVTAVAIPYIRAKISAERYERLLTYVDVAVKAAEQIFPAEKTAEKKSYVYGYIKELGFDFDEIAIDNAIEAAVLNVHNALKE